MKPLDRLTENLQTEFRKSLAHHDVKWPGGQSLTTLLYLYKAMPDWIHKDELTRLVRAHHPGSGDLQDARHLADKGWDIVSSNPRFTRGRRDLDGPKDSYQLGSIVHPNPIWLTKNKVKRKGVMNADSWNELLLMYSEHGCAVCGQKADTYDKGHLDPTKPPILGNIVPMCVECNQFAQAHEHTFTLKGLVARGYNPNLALIAA